MSDDNKNNGNLFDEEEYQKFAAEARLTKNYSDSDSSDEDYGEEGCGHPAEPNHECPYTEPTPHCTTDYHEFYPNSSQTKSLRIGNQTINPTKSKEDPDLIRAASRLCLACKLNYRCHNQLLECLNKDPSLAHKSHFLHNLQVSIDNIGNCGCYLSYDY